MGRTIAAVAAAGIVLFFWSFMSWVVLPIHTPTIKQIPQADSVLAVMKANIHEKGVYYFPWLDAEHHNDPGAMDAWNEQYRRGPVGFMVFDPAGNEPFNPGALGLSLVFEFVAAAVGIWLYKRSTAPLGNYFSRATYFGVIGILISVTVYMQEWIHMKFPLPYILAFCTDSVVGWLL